MTLAVNAAGRAVEALREAATDLLVAREALEAAHGIYWGTNIKQPGNMVWCYLFDNLERARRDYARAAADYNEARAVAVLALKVK